MKVRLGSNSVTVLPLMQYQERERVVYFLTVVSIAILGCLFITTVERIREGNVMSVPPIIAIALIIAVVLFRMPKNPVAFSANLLRVH